VSQNCELKGTELLSKGNSEMRITELQNELTMDLDVTPAASMMNLFQQTNQQIFSGWKNELHINEKYHLGMLYLIPRLI
jgi:hypothetical protein